MTIKFEKIKPGMTLYDVRKNTGMSGGKWCTWHVHIIEVNSEKRTVVASWNGNRPETMGENRVTKYRAKQPENKIKN